MEIVTNQVAPKRASPSVRQVLQHRNFLLSRHHRRSSLLVVSETRTLKQSMANVVQPRTKATERVVIMREEADGVHQLLISAIF